jgi:hypothetical protein
MIKIALKTEPVIDVKDADIYQGVIAIKRERYDGEFGLLGYVTRTAGGGMIQLVNVDGVVQESKVIATAPNNPVWTFNTLSDLIGAFPEYAFYQLNHDTNGQITDR